MKTGMFLYRVVMPLVILTSCAKSAIQLPGRNPVDNANQRTFKLVFENPNTAQMPPQGLTAALTIEDMQIPGRHIKVSVPVICNQVCSTQQINLPAGQYLIKGLILTDSVRTAKFATPVAGSAKAALVNKPLSLALELSDVSEKIIHADLLAIGGNDTPESFGYTAGSFGNRDTGNPETEIDKLVFIRPVIKIGEVVYDSIPVQLIVKSWDARNEMTYNIHYLRAGLQGIYLPAKAVKYTLSISKWGTFDEISLEKENIQEHAVYTIGGQTAAQKLKTVYEYQVINGVSHPLSKTEYEYQGNGSLKQMLIWRKRQDNSTYLARKDIYEYTGGKITMISSYNDSDSLLGTLAAEYNAAGKLSSVEEIKGTKFTRAAISYTALDTRSGISQDYRIESMYTYEHGFFTTHHNKTITGGSLLTDVTTTGNGNWEEGRYDSDFCINPYVHLNIPDLSLNQYIKHNIKNQWKTWYGAFPEYEAYSFNYSYNSGGYPTERSIAYRSYRTKADAYTIKTVFVY